MRTNHGTGNALWRDYYLFGNGIYRDPASDPANS
jgi:hypothetical protein